MAQLFHDMDVVILCEDVGVLIAECNPKTRPSGSGCTHTLANNSSAKIRFRGGGYYQAKVYFEKVLRIYHKRLPKEHPKIKPQ